METQDHTALKARMYKPEEVLFWEGKKKCEWVKGAY